MADYICIDGGTTNTRLRLVCDRQIADAIHLDIGVVRAAEKPEEYRFRLKCAVETLLQRHPAAKVTRILASGMITSDLGLYALPHASVPAGLRELHDSAVETVLADISPIPFVFIRGLKTGGTDIAGTDVMRGEETELMGLLMQKDAGACTCILPGSHSKVIYTDAQGRITGFFTAMTGEMVAALAGHTILKNSVSLEGTVIEEAQLLAGYEYCLAEGLNKALFKVRVADTVLGMEKSALYSFFLGAVLCGEVGAILKKAEGRIVVGGRRQLRDALCILLKHAGSLGVACLSQEETDACVALGAVKIFEFTEETKQ